VAGGLTAVVSHIDITATSISEHGVENLCPRPVVTGSCGFAVDVGNRLLRAEGVAVVIGYRVLDLPIRNRAGDEVELTPPPKDKDARAATRPRHGEYIRACVECIRFVRHHSGRGSPCPAAIK